MTKTTRVNATKTKMKIKTSKGTMTELQEVGIEFVRRGKRGLSRPEIPACIRIGCTDSITGRECTGGWSRCSLERLS